MSLSPGTRLGPYEIVAPLGSGGMGEVYRARDTKLGREVAIKVLPDRRRTRRRATGPLQAGGAGAGLPEPSEHRGHLRAGGRGRAHGSWCWSSSKAKTFPIGWSAGGSRSTDALAIASRWRTLWTEATSKGIVHRDLKPANVKLTPDGKVKVLDFGLAKALVGEGSASGPMSTPTILPTMTTRRDARIGMILGTAAYMSPEQARGKPLDRRTDVWAFGCVLYEMLTGSRAFQGEDITDTLAAIVRGEPDWTRLPAGLPPAVRVLLEQCLVKDRAERLSDMSVVRFLMSDAAQTLSGTARVGQGGRLTRGVPAPRRTSRPGRRRARRGRDVRSHAMAAARRAPPRPAPSSTSAIVLPDGVELGSTHLLPVALSDDGTRIAFVGLRDGKNQIYVRTLSERRAESARRHRGRRRPVLLSRRPVDRLLRRIEAPEDRGGRRRAGDAGRRAVPPRRRLGHDGYIYFAPTNAGGLWRVPEGGGAATEVTRKDVGRRRDQPSLAAADRRHRARSCSPSGRGRETTSTTWPCRRSAPRSIACS